MSLESQVEQIGAENAEFLRRIEALDERQRTHVAELHRQLDSARAWATQLEEENALLSWLHAEALWKLALPCGSCHPCINWSEETWDRAGRKPPPFDLYQIERREQDEAVALLSWLLAESEWKRTHEHEHRFPWPNLEGLPRPCACGKPFRPAPSEREGDKQ